SGRAHRPRRIFRPAGARRHDLAGPYHRGTGRHAGPYPGGAHPDLHRRAARRGPAGAGHVAGMVSFRASPPAASPAGGAAYHGGVGMGWGEIAGYWPFIVGLMATGVVSGVAAGLLGIGGGSILVPALANALLLMGFGGDVV